MFAPIVETPRSPRLSLSGGSVPMAANSRNSRDLKEFNVPQTQEINNVDEEQYAAIGNAQADKFLKEDRITSRAEARMRKIIGGISILIAAILEVVFLSRHEMQIIPGVPALFGGFGWSFLRMGQKGV